MKSIFKSIYRRKSKVKENPCVVDDFLFKRIIVNEFHLLFIGPWERKVFFLNEKNHLIGALYAQTGDLHETLQYRIYSIYARRWN